MLNKFKGLSVNLQLFILFICCYFFALSIIYAMFYSELSSKMKQKSDILYNNTLKNVSTNMDNQIILLEKLVMMMNQTTWVKNIAASTKDDMENLNYIDGENYIRDLKTLVSISGISSDIAIYMKKSDYIISSTERSDFDWYFSKAFNIKNMDKNRIRDMIENKNEQIFGPVEVSSYNIPRKGFLYIRTVPIMTQKVSIMMFIEDVQIQNSLLELEGISDTGYLLLDDEQKIVSADEEGKAVQKNLPDKIDFTKKTKINGKDYYIYASTGQKTNWTYLLVVPKQLMGVKALDAWGTALVLMLILFLSFAFVFKLVSYVIKNQLSRIYSIIGNLGSDKTQRSIKNELYLIEKSIKSLIDQEEELNNKINVQRPLMQKACLSLLLNNEISDSEVFRRTMHFIGITLNRALASILVLKGINQEQVASLAETAITKITEAGGDAYRVQISDNETILILYDKEFEANIIEGIDTLLSGEYGHNFYGGLGRSVDNLFNASLSYSDALWACKWRIVKGRGIIIKYHEISANDIQEKINLDENQLVNYVKSTDEAAAQELIGKVYKEIKQGRYLPEEAEIYFINIWKCLSTLANQMNLPNTFSVGVPPAPTSEELYIYTMERLRELVKAIEKKKILQQVCEKDKIVEFVEKNIANKTLSLKMVAAEFSMSIPTLSRFFTKEIGENFLTFVQKRRIELSKQYLTEGKLEIQIIAELVGFDNDVTFRRVFKSIEGITPISFRGLKD